MRTQGSLARLLILAGTLTALTAPAVAQGEPRVRIGVETNVVTISGHDLLPAGVEVIRAGTVAGTGVARPITSGEISYVVVWRSEPKRLSPGDLVRYRGVEPALEITVPEIRADVDEATGSVVGIGPSGADVRLRIGYHATSGTVRSFEEVAPCGTDGRFAVDLPDAALAPGDHGTATWSDPSGHEFIAPFGVFQGTLTIDRPKLSLASALGQAARLEHRAVGATAAVSHSLVTGGAADEARLDVTDVILATPVEAGSSITITRQRPLVGRTSVDSLLVPVLKVDVLPATDQVVGTAPASTPVGVTLRAPDGRLHLREVTSSSDGRVAVDFAGAVDIERGWEATFEIAAGDEWRVRAMSVAALVHIELDAGIVRGETAALQPVVVTAIDEDGHETHRWTTDASGDGQFGVRLTVSGAPRAGEILALRPGTILGVDLTGGGDPMLFVAPDLGARADIDREVIAGVAPPGHDIVVEVRGTNQIVARSDVVTVDNSGRYEALLMGVYDVEPGTDGRVTATRPDGHQWSVSWVAHRTTLDLRSGAMSVLAPTNQAAAIQLFDSSGACRGAAAWQTRLVSTWRRGVTEYVRFTDRFGREVVPVVGDTVTGRIGSDTFEFRVPRLEAVAYLSSDTISGSTDAPEGTPLRLEATDADTGRTVRTSSVPAGGAFTFDLTRAAGQEEPFDLRHNVTVSLRLGRAARFSLVVTVPGLDLDLTRPNLSGTLPPGAEGDVRWSRAGHLLGQVPLIAAADGSFEVDLRLPDGTPFVLVAGDEIAVDAPGLGLDEPVRLGVPRLDLTLDVPANALHGRVVRPSGSRFGLETWRLNVDPGRLGGGRWTDMVTWLDDERFAIDFDEHPVADGLGGEAIFTLVSGAVAEATLRLPDGHITRRWRLLPMLNVQHGADLVCGEGEPDAPVRLELRDVAGATQAVVNTRAGPAGRFTAHLNPDGAIVRIAAGTRIDASIDRQQIGLAVPPMDIAFDWSALTMDLDGLPGQKYEVWYPGDVWDCWGDIAGSGTAIPGQGVTSYEQTSDAEGNLHHDATYLANRDASPVRGVMVQTIEPTLQRVFALIFGTRVEVHLGTDLVLGRSSPYAELEARVADADGTIRGRAWTVAGLDGGFVLRIAPEGGAVLQLQRGQTLEIVGQGEEVRLVLPALDFDFDAATGVTGMGTPDADVSLTLRLADGRVFTTDVRSDSRGRFAFSAADIPAGEDWTLAAVGTVRAAFVFARDHAVVRDMADVPGAGATVTPPATSSATPRASTPTPTARHGTQTTLYLPRMDNAN